MSKLFIDNNIVLDLLMDREPFSIYAERLMAYANSKNINLFISSLTIANSYYIIAKNSSDLIARESIRKFKIYVTVLDLNDKIIKMALNDSNFKDFEDGLQYYTAMENNCKIIITRNIKDFKHSQIPILTAKQFLAR